MIFYVYGLEISKFQTKPTLLYLIDLDYYCHRIPHSLKLKISKNRICLDLSDARLDDTSSEFNVCCLKHRDCPKENVDRRKVFVIHQQMVASYKILTALDKANEVKVMPGSLVSESQSS